MKMPCIANGQALLWSEDEEVGIHGVTELTECERTKDEWLRSVQDEFRRGQLTAETHAFLHGKITMQPGSVIDGNVSCNRKLCQRRSAQASKMKMFCKAFAELTVATECRICRMERSQRQLVANIPTDPRFHNDVFRDATAVFANNDITYEANKLRAQKYALRQRQGIIYCPAKDILSTKAMRLHPDLSALKVSWLNRHDSESGGLHGMLPLMKGMPVAVNKNINRSYDIRILKGRVGYIHSWILDPSDMSQYEDSIRVLQKLPTVVLVKFYTKDKHEETWRLPGLPENGLYPIIPCSNMWYLDNIKKLRIVRRQIPLSPAWAITSHTAQGQTFHHGMIVDLNIAGSSSDISKSYMAITRVEDRKHLLIFRPFPLEIFQQGQRQGKELLLKVWRREHIDWKAIEQELRLIPVVCPVCATEAQIDIEKLWQRNATHRFCRVTCMECETISRIGHWRCSQHVNRITVKEWLNTYSYKNIKFYKHRSRPPTATAELFRSSHTIITLET